MGAKDETTTDQVSQGSPAITDLLDYVSKHPHKVVALFIALCNCLTSLYDQKLLPEKFDQDHLHITSTEPLKVAYSGANKEYSPKLDKRKDLAIDQLRGYRIDACSMFRKVTPYRKSIQLLLTVFKELTASLPDDFISLIIAREISGMMSLNYDYSEATVRLILVACQRVNQGILLLDQIIKKQREQPWYKQQALTRGTTAQIMLWQKALQSTTKIMRDLQPDRGDYLPDRQNCNKA